MTKSFLILLGTLMVSSVSFAQDYGLTLGVHQTTATIDTAGSTPALPPGSVSGKLGFDAGLTVSFELMPAVRFRSGLLYDQRQIDYKLSSSSGGTVSYNFAYLDVPVNAQYNFTPMFGLYGGLIVGIKASDSTSVPGTSTSSPNMKLLYPLVNVGANFMFNDLIGFDLYYEYGLGYAADNVQNFSTVGMHFIYWL